MWEVWHRYHRFCEFRKSLTCRGVDMTREVFPGKRRLDRHSISLDVVRERGPALARWLCGVLQAPGALTDPAVLEFAGLLACESRSKLCGARPPVHVSNLALQTGDVVLFRTKAALPAVQRAVTGSDWDHVGLVVHVDKWDNVCSATDALDVGIVECDVSGCHCASPANRTTPAGQPRSISCGRHRCDRLLGTRLRRKAVAPRVLRHCGVPRLLYPSRVACRPPMAPLAGQQVRRLNTPGRTEADLASTLNPW